MHTMSVRMPTPQNSSKLEKTWTMIAKKGMEEAGKLLMKR